MLSLVLYNFIIEIVDVVEYFVSQNGSSSSLKLENDVPPLRICALAIDLRTEQQIAGAHVPEIVFFIVNQVLIVFAALLRLRLHFLPWFVGARVQHVMILEEVMRRRQHFLHVFTHLKQDYV